MAPEDEASPSTPEQPAMAESPRSAGVPAWLEFVTSRWVVKTAFLVFFAFTVVQLLRFERWAKGVGPYVKRPEAVAGILPIGHFTSFFAWVRGGGWDSILPAGLVLILMSLAVSLPVQTGHVWLDLPRRYHMGGVRRAWAQGDGPKRAGVAVA